MTNNQLNIEKETATELENNTEMLTSQSRRQFIRGFGLMVGSGVAAGLLSGNAISAAITYKAKIDSTLQPGLIFSRAQLVILKHICAQVIPATDTLGAADVDTHGFIDHQLHYCHSEDEQKKAVQLLGLVDKKAQSRYVKPFSEIQTNQQTQLLNELEQATNEFNQQNRSDFKFLKSLICFGYYTSEVGASKELRYLAVPGGFKGSIPYSKGDPNWATN